MIKEALVALLRPGLRGGDQLIRGRQNASAAGKPYVVYNLRHLTPPAFSDKLPVDRSGTQRKVTHSPLQVDLGFYGLDAFERGLNFVAGVRVPPYEVSRGLITMSILKIGTLMDLTGTYKGSDEQEEYAFLEMKVLLSHGVDVDVGLIETVVVEGKMVGDGADMVLPDRTPGPPGSWIQSLGIVKVVEDEEG